MENKAKEKGEHLCSKLQKTCLLYQMGITADCTWQTIQITWIQWIYQTANKLQLTPSQVACLMWLICYHLLEDIKANGILQSWAIPCWNLLMLSRSFVFQIENQKIWLQQHTDLGSNKGVPCTSRIRKDKEILLQA